MCGQERGDDAGVGLGSQWPGHRQEVHLHQPTFVGPVVADGSEFGWLRARDGCSSHPPDRANLRVCEGEHDITDLGMELGKMFFWKRHANAGLQLSPLVRHDWRRMKVSAGLILMFVLGGITGALGFKHIGFICVVPLAALLLVLSVPPFMRDAAQSAERPSLFSKKN